MYDGVEVVTQHTPFAPFAMEIEIVDTETTLKPHIKRLTNIVGNKFELTNLIARRALQLSFGRPTILKYEDETELPIDPIDLATLEFVEQPEKFPLAVKRTLPDGRSEILRVHELSWIDH